VKISRLKVGFTFEIFIEFFFFLVIVMCSKFAVWIYLLRLSTTNTDRHNHL